MQEASPTGSAGGEYTSSNMDNSPEEIVDADFEEKGEEIKLRDTENISRQQEDKPQVQKQNVVTDEGKEEGEICEQSQLEQRSKDEHNVQNRQSNLESGDDVSKQASGEGTPLQRGDEAAAIEQRKTKVTN